MFDSSKTECKDEVVRETRNKGHAMLFFQFTLVKRCLILLVTMASQDMLLTLALQTQVTASTVLQKQRKSNGFRF